MFKSIVFLISFGAFSFVSASNSISIGTGGLSGTYYPTGNAICHFFNKMEKNDTKCRAKPTKGSRDNITNIQNKKLDLGIAQSDVVYQAYTGTGKFQGKKVSKLRSVIAIYPELLALIVNKNANINKLEEIKGKRINLGTRGSGNEATVKVLFKQFGIKNSDLLLWNSASTQESPRLLMKNKIDGYFYMVGHPAKNIIEAKKDTDIEIIPIVGENIDKLIEKYPYYAKGYIPADTYEGISSDIQSVGVKAVLVTRKSMDEKIVKNIIKGVIDNFQEFKQKHPAYKSITIESLVEGLSAPLHKSAKEYYKEMGILE